MLYNTKRLQLILFMFLNIGLLSSCSKVLDQQPQNEVGDGAAIVNKKGAQAAVAGMYNELQNGDYYGRNFQIISDVSADQAQSIGTWDFYREMDTYQVSLGNQENGYFYARAYRAINLANHIIEKVPALADATDAEKNKMIGNAYFIRALSYFDLLRVYGGVPGKYGTMGLPIVTTPFKGIDASTMVARSTLAEGYAQVEADLLKAETALLVSSDRTMASKSAARALLSRLYLYTGNNAKVLQYSNLVIGDANYTLLPNFLEIFNGKLTTESILELNFNSTDQSGMRTWYVPTTKGGRGDLCAHTSFYQTATADPKDVRGTLFAYEPTAKIYYPTKYIKAGNIDNVHILRMAEMYLNRAEAKANTDDLTGALADLNLVRKRAGVADTAAATKAAVLGAIWRERNLEFAFEGHRFFDLVRTGQALTALVNVERKNGSPVTLDVAGRQVFPIPSFEVDANNKIIQNEAYK